MRRPAQIERLYVDFDGFFASVEQTVRPRLRGRPVGVVPFDGAGRTCIIACSREAKIRGVKNVMPVHEARELCPDIVLVPQSPDLYRRAHNALMAEISCVTPIDAIKSIDELTCRVEPRDRGDPSDLVARIKSRLAASIGSTITCSVGAAANRLLAKMACKAGKRPSPGLYGDGFAAWPPEAMPGPLLPIPLADVPGVGSRMATRLALARIDGMQALLAAAPKHLRRIWGSVTGERLWYALNGYDVQAQASARGMYGHGRVLPPEDRSAAGALATARLLAVKAARRMRREGYYAGLIYLSLSMRDTRWGDALTLPAVRDDHAILTALAALWARAPLGRRPYIVQVAVTLGDLTPATERQLDILTDDDRDRQRWESATDAIDRLNHRYGRTVVSLGLWRPPSGGNVGGKISFTRIPRSEDFQ